MADENRYYGGYGRDGDRDFGSRGSYGGGGSYDSDRYGGGSSYGGYGREGRDRGYGAYSRGDSFGREERGRYGQTDRDYGRDERMRAYDRGNRDNERFDNRDQDREVAIDETSELIASNKVEGTRVYNRRGERLGTIYNFMVHKRTGQVQYAVMSFGGFLGLGERYYPLPWQVLTYEERMGGYVVDLDERMLERAPSFGRGEEPRFDRGYGQHVNSYYGLRF